MSSGKILLISLFLILASILVSACTNEDIGYNDEIGRKIAVYNGFGAWDSSATAIALCLEDAGWVVELKDEGDIQTSLDSIGVVVIGGGNPEQIAASLGFTGNARITNLVERGGGYIGLGAGAYLAGDSMVFNNFPSIEATMGLFYGYAFGPMGQIANLPNYTMTTVNLDIDAFNPSGVDALQVLYYGGPQCIINDPITAETVAWFNLTQAPAAWRFQRGQGHVVLCSVHPEIEENDLRDGSDFGHEMNDGESDWFWLQEMVQWCMQNIRE